MAETSTPPDYYVGVDAAGVRLVAGVFSASRQLMGKVKFSPKPERGPRTVIDRVARCIRDAVDESDLALKDVSGVGLAVPGTVRAEAGLVLSALDLGWENVPLQQELEQRLQVPVALENDGNVAALGIYAQELESKPRNLVAVFLERPSAVGRIMHGAFATEPLGAALAPGFQLRPDLKDPAVRNPAKKLRKALQAGDELAARTVHALALQAGGFIAQLIDLLNPDVLALGGGAVDELKEWLLPVILKQVREGVRPESVDDVEIFVSELGKDAAIVGGAVLAAQRFP
jgi:glucokinase